MTMSYKGYLAGPIVFDDDQGLFSGTVEGLRDLVHFTGTTATELTQSFRESIDDYLDLCRTRGRTADQPCDLNQWVERQLENATKP